MFPAGYRISAKPCSSLVKSPDTCLCMHMALDIGAVLHLSSSYPNLLNPRRQLLQPAAQLLLARRGQVCGHRGAKHMLINQVSTSVRNINDVSVISDCRHGHGNGIAPKSPARPNNPSCSRYRAGHLISAKLPYIIACCAGFVGVAYS